MVPATYRVYLNYFYRKILTTDFYGFRMIKNVAEIHQNSSINSISTNMKKYINKLHTVLETHTEWL